MAKQKTVAQWRIEAEKAIKTYGQTSPSSYWPQAVIAIVKQYEKLWRETEALRQLEMFKQSDLQAKGDAQRKVGV